MSRRHSTSGWEFPLVLAVMVGGMSALVFLIVVLVTGARP